MEAWEKLRKIFEDQGIFSPSYNNEAERFRQMVVVKSEQEAGHTTNTECLQRMKRIMRVSIRP